MTVRRSAALLILAAASFSAAAGAGGLAVGGGLRSLGLRYSIKDDATTTTTTATTPTECEVDGRIYQDGSQVEGIGTTCQTCFCLQGEVTCRKLTCADPIDGCTPIMQEGYCCPVMYDCGGEVSPDQLALLLEAKMANQKNALPEWQSMARMSPGGEATISDVETHRSPVAPPDIASPEADLPQPIPNEAATEDVPVTEVAPNEEETTKEDLVGEDLATTQENPPPRRKPLPTLRPMARPSPVELAKRRQQSRFTSRRPIPTRIFRENQNSRTRPGTQSLSYRLRNRGHHNKSASDIAKTTSATSTHTSTTSATPNTSELPGIFSVFSKMTTQSHKPIMLPTTTTHEPIISITDELKTKSSTRTRTRTVSKYSTSTSQKYRFSATTTTPKPSVITTVIPRASTTTSRAAPVLTTTEQEGESLLEVTGVGHVGEAFLLKDTKKLTTSPPRRNPPTHNWEKNIEIGTGVNVKGSLEDTMAFGPILIFDNRVRTNRQKKDKNETENATETATVKEEEDEISVTDIPLEETTMLTEDNPIDEVKVSDEPTKSREPLNKSETIAEELTTILSSVLLPESTITPQENTSTTTQTSVTTSATPTKNPSSTLPSVSETSPTEDTVDIGDTDIEVIDTDADLPSYDITVGTSVLASDQTQPGSVGVGEVIPVELEPEHKEPEIEATSEISRPSLLGTLLNIFTRPERPLIRPERPLTRPDRPLIRPERPLTRLERPSTRLERPPPRLERPLPRPERPSTQSERSPTQPKTPTNESERPPTETERPATQPERKPARTERPATQPERKPTRTETPATQAERQPTQTERPATQPERQPAQPDTLATRLERPSNRPERLPPRLSFRPRPRPNSRPEFIPPRVRFTPPPPPKDKEVTTQSSASGSPQEEEDIYVSTAKPSHSAASPSQTDPSPSPIIPAIIRPSPIHNQPITLINLPDPIHTRPAVPFNRPSPVSNQPAPAPEQLGTSQDLPSEPIIESGFQGIRSEGEGIQPNFDFNIDYENDGEPTLPPSLPNLKIIPFVAADALTKPKIGFSSEDLRSTPHPLVPILVPDLDEDKVNINNETTPIPTQPETKDSPSTTTTTTPTTTRRTFSRLPIGDHRPPILPPRRTFNRPSSNDSSTRRPFLPFRRTGDRPTRLPFTSRPAISDTTTTSPESFSTQPTISSRPDIPYADRERPATRPSFVPPRRVTSPRATTTEATTTPTFTSELPQFSPVPPSPKPTTTIATQPSRPILSNDISNLLLQDVFELPEGQNTPPVRFASSQGTPKPIIPVKTAPVLPEIPPAVRDQLPLATDPVLASGLLKLSGCNIYGRMYVVKDRIPELSAKCKECRCTPVGVQCLPIC